MPFTLEELLPHDQRLRTVQLHKPVRTALDLMHQHGYDQLPVVDKDGKTSLELVVTFDSILQALRSFKTRAEFLQVRDVARSVSTHPADADLLTTLDDIQRENFALIVNEENLLTGIVTTADTTVFFREYAEDLMLIEGIESGIKEAIQALYAGDGTDLESAIAAVTDRSADVRKKLPSAIRGYVEKCGLSFPGTIDQEAFAEAEKRLNLPKPGKTFEYLSFDEFVEVLLRHPNAPKLPQSSDVTELRGLLQQVRHSRNKLVHFRGELSLDERQTIHFAAEWLERNLPRVAAPVPPPPVLAPPPAGEVGHEEDDEGPQGSYAKLSAHLRLQDAETTSMTLTFGDIERILEKALPKSAYEYRAWWANDPTKPQSAAWLEEGWRAMAISMSERRLSFVRTDDREKAYIEFFASLNSRLKDEPGFPLREVSPQGASWHILASLPWLKPESAIINAAFTRRKEMRIELYLDCGSKEQNKQRFDELLTHKDVIETSIGEPLQWERMDTKRSCRVAVYTKGQILTDYNSDSLLGWATKKAVDFHAVFSREFPATSS